MADLGTISWKVEVDTTDLKKSNQEMDTAKKSADNFEKSTKKAGTTATTTGKKTKTATGEMSKGFNTAKRAVVGFAAVLGAASIARSFSNAISATNAFNASVSELSAITGAVGEDLEFFAEQSKDIGRTTSLSASQAATAFKLIASAKPDLLESADALAAVTREAVTLAEAAKIDLTQAADTVGVSLNQFAAGAEEANRFVNVLAAGSKFGASAIAETSMALKNSGAAANAAGLSFEETNAAIQALAAGGIKAGEAGTGLRNVILILEQELDDNLKPSVVGISSALATLADKELTITEMTDIFGRQNVVAAQTLVDNAAAVGALEKALTGTSVATEQARINMDNLSGDILEGKSATEGLQIALGEKLTPSLREARQDMTEFTNSVTRFVESDEFLKWVGLATDALKVFSAVVATGVVISMGTATAAFIAAQTSLAAFTATAVAAAGPLGIGLLIGSLAALVIAYNNVKEAQGGARESAAEWIASTGGLEDLQLSITGVTNDIIDLAMEMAILDQSAIKNNEEFNRLAMKRVELTAFLVELIELETPLLEAKNREEEAAIALSTALAETTGVLNLETIGLVDTDIDLLKVSRFLNTTFQRSEFRMEGVTDATEDYADTTNDLLSALEQEIDDLSKTERELFQLTATRQLDEDATRAEIAAVMDLSGALFDQQTQIEATDAAEKEAQRVRDKNVEDTQAASLAAAEAMEIQWGETRDTFAGFFIDFATNGSDAFGGILKSFKAMLIEMLAQWAASGIMKLLGFGGGGGTASGGFSLFGGGGGDGGGGAANAAVSGAASGAANAAVTGAADSTLIGSGAAAAIAAGPGTALSTAAFAVKTFLKTPLGIAGLALAAGAIVADLLDDSGTFSHNAGMLTQDLEAVPDDRKFEIDPFASGAQFTGFNRRAGQDDAIGVIDIFRAYDAALTQAAIAAGLTPNIRASDFIGFNEKGEGVGAFFGSASEDGGGQGIPIEQQLDKYGARWIELVGRTNGVAANVIADIIGDGSAGGILERAQAAGAAATASAVPTFDKPTLTTTQGTAGTGVDGSFQTGLDRVPRDGFIAELHRGERVLTSSEADRDDLTSGETAGGQSFFSMIKIFIFKFNKLFKIIDNWDGEGLPGTRARDL